MGATPIDDNDADGKSGKLYGWLLIIRCTSILSALVYQIASNQNLIFRSDRKGEEG